MPITFRKHPGDITKSSSDRCMQHWVPAFYQRLWCDPSTPNGAFHWVRSKVRPNIPRRCSPRATFRDREINTMSAHGRRNLALERMFSCIEDAYAPILGKISSGAPLLNDDVMTIRGLMAAQLIRTPKFRKHIIFLESSKNASVLEYCNQQSKIHLSQTIENIRTNATQLFTIFSFPSIFGIFNKMAMKLFISDDPAAFITSDAPCILIETKKSTQTNPFALLASENAAVLMPLSPSVIAILRSQTAPDEGIRIFPESRNFVHAQNAAILLASDNYIVTNRKDVAVADWLSPSISNYLSQFQVY